MYHFKNVLTYLRIYQESKPRSTFDHIWNFHSFFFSHESKNGENDRCREKGSSSVDSADEHGIFVAIVMKFVIGTQGQKRSNADAIGEENLSAAIYPAFTGLQSFPIRSKQEFDTIHGAI